MVPPSDHMPVPSVSEDPYVADLLKVADENIACLREEAQIAREETTGLEGKVANLQHQVKILFLCLNNNKFILQPFLLYKPGEPASERSLLLDFYVACRTDCSAFHPMPILSSRPLAGVPARTRTAH